MTACLALASALVDRQLTNNVPYGRIFARLQRWLNISPSCALIWFARSRILTDLSICVRDLQHPKCDKWIRKGSKKALKHNCLAGRAVIQDPLVPAAAATMEEFIVYFDHDKSIV